VSARRVHLPPARIGAERAELTDEARHYLCDVLRLEAGAPVELFDGEGATWEATLAPDLRSLRLGTRREVSGRGAPVWLLFALAKGEKNDLVVQKATELGAARIVPFAAERSVVRLEPARARERAARWRRIAEEAARQCGRSDVPEVPAPVPLAEALAALPPGVTRVVFQPGGLPLSALDPGGAGWAAVIGPEGGLAPEELAACQAAGARLASLGPRVVRAETAAIVAVALLQARFGDLR
jgi:16S rRNA (uracil1498-N3)-methyltransferase